MTGSRSSRLLPVLLLLFIGSGCAALIYEIVWFQMLSLIVGSSAISLGVLLGTFMGGMCIGSLLLPKYVTATEHPLRVYAMLEAGIAVCGIAILFGLPYVGGFYAAIGGSGFGGLLINGLFCALCLLLPTVLHGRHAPGGRALGRDYAARRVMARLLLRRQHRRRGLRVPARRLLPAARTRRRRTPRSSRSAINVAVAVIGFVLSRTTPYTATAVNLRQQHISA